jgi:hypothetical protein
MAPCCAPLLVEVAMVGVAAVGVVVPPLPLPDPPLLLLPPPPHPKSILPDKKTAASNSCPARIFLVSRSRRLNLLQSAATMRALSHKSVNCEFAGVKKIQC